MSCNDIQLNGAACPVPAVELPKAGERSFLGAIGRSAISLFDGLLALQERAKQRSHLSRLDDHMLRDMGLTRDQVSREAAKPFWRA